MSHDTAPLIRHLPWCDRKRHDEDVCVATDIRLPGQWLAGLSGCADDELPPVVWLNHPSLLIDEEGALDPHTAIAIGEALLRLGRAALAPTN
jgi:hypothetical protein